VNSADVPPNGAGARRDCRGPRDTREAIPCAVVGQHTHERALAETQNVVENDGGPDTSNLLTDSERRPT
jgi:hypothetical protein